MRAAAIELDARATVGGRDVLDGQVRLALVRVNAVAGPGRRACPGEVQPVDGQIGHRPEVNRKAADRVQSVGRIVDDDAGACGADELGVDAGADAVQLETGAAVGEDVAAGDDGDAVGV